MTPTQRAAAERLAAYHAEQADHFSPFGSGNALTIFHGEAAALLRELLAEPPAWSGDPSTQDYASTQRELAAEPQSEPAATDKESLTVEPAQAFYKASDAEPAYAQYERGYTDGFAAGMREARIAIEDGAANEPQGEPVAAVTECEACFTPDVCQLRGKCDHYAASQLRVTKQAHPPQQRTPLTDYEIDRFWMNRPDLHDGELLPQLRDFAHAIERAHGITGEPT